MPVGIAQVLNGTAIDITYNNLESGRQFGVQGRTRSQFDNDKLPSSEPTDDTLPWYDSGRDDKYIAIGALGHNLRLCERDARFHIYDNNGHSLSFGHLTNGYRYVCRFDPIKRPNGQDGLSVSVYVYVDAMHSSNGEVSATMLQDHEPSCCYDSDYLDLVIYSYVLKLFKHNLLQSFRVKKSFAACFEVLIRTGFTRKKIVDVVTVHFRN